MISHPTRNLAPISTAGFLRSFGVGLMGGVRCESTLQAWIVVQCIGLFIAMGLAGSAYATIVSIAADRIGRKSR